VDEENTANDPVIRACVELAGRAQARSFQIGPGVAGWYAQVLYRGNRIIVEELPSPRQAAMAMARRLLQGATCRCGRAVTLVSEAGACLWRLDGDRWKPGCDAAPMTPPPGAHGNWAALAAAVPKSPPPSRADRMRRHGVGRVLDDEVGGDASWLD
jgi:hypothetical protein